jgi:hypothetical protein
MKTTIDLSDGLLLRVKELARRDGRTMRDVLEEGLEMVLASKSSRKAVKIAPVTFGGSGLSEEYRTASWDRIRAAAYEGRGS